jgi:hypothetical protein
LASFVLLQVGLRVVIDFWQPRLRDPTFEIKYQQFQKALSRCADRRSVSVCMFGSSVTGRAFNGKYVEKLLAESGFTPAVAYNMSDHAAGPLTHLVYLRRLLERGVHPDAVLIEIFPFVFNNPKEPADIVHFPLYRLDERDLAVVQRYSSEPDLRRRWWTERLIPCYCHRFPLVHNLCLALVPSREQVPMWREYDDHGWCESTPLEPEALQQNLQRVRAQFEERFRAFKPGKATLQAFEECLALLRQEPILAAVVMMPQGPTMRSLYCPDGVRELKEKVTTLCRRYQTDFLDAYTWLDEEMFLDSFHPNTVGAKLFSDRLAKECLEPLLNRRKRP